jgi:uncharacterized protein with HEPN domain
VSACSPKPKRYERQSSANIGLPQPYAEAIARIEDYTRDFDHEAFDADPRTQDAVIRNLEVLGEAARNILRHDPGFVTAHHHVPWAEAYRMRNALSHGYADIDLKTVWNTVRSHLPALRVQLTKLLG